jgi:hypothetical protein
MAWRNIGKLKRVRLEAGSSMFGVINDVVLSSDPLEELISNLRMEEGFKAVTISSTVTLQKKAIQPKEVTPSARDAFASGSGSCQSDHHVSARGGSQCGG